MTRWHFPLRRSLGAMTLAASLVAGCSGPDQAPAATTPETPAAELNVALEEAFVAIPRTVSTEQAQQVQQKLDGAVEDSGQSFYIAIRKSELAQKWFLSAFLKQNFPGGVSYSAASSLGTRVVSFKVQNGKLFVFDVDDRKANSDVFDPQVLVEAYPVITNYDAFNRTRGSDQYVLFDPTAGLNHFGVVGDQFGEYAQRFQVELSFAQRFRKITDGVTFEQVFTGYSDTPDPGSGDLLEKNQFRTSGTLGIGLRKYTEGAGYTPTELPPQEYFFRSEPRIIPNTGAITQTAAKWNVHPGMKPIKWYITDNIKAVQADPRYANYDVVGAVKRGIENWNAVFGYKVFEAVVGDSSLGFADDDKNVLIFDPDDSVGFAFANWRTNPNTGEIRGASVYFNTLWLEYADSRLGGGASATAKSTAKAQRPTRLTWAGMKSDSLCELAAPQFRPDTRGRTPVEKAGTTSAAAAALTKKQIVENYVTHVVLHEVGHTLGLRHNFAGSLAFDGSPSTPRSSSVMEYVYDPDAVYVSTPGPYDVQAIRLLYGLSSDLPTYPFCTDEDTELDPYCLPYDRYDDPLTYWVGPYHQLVLDLILTGSASYADLADAFDYYGNREFGFIRAGDAGTQAYAYDIAMAQVRPPLAVPDDIPGYGARADFLATRILSRLYLDPAGARGSFVNNPANTQPLTARVIGDLSGIVLNVDGIRSPASRRTAVDILKTHQSLAAYSALRTAKDTLVARLPTLTGDELLRTEDLLARINAAISPYYR
ncbi:zinc-dependent metalloprotease [Corallococcus sp. M34]|uniref:zinc-dependent metalloprotease n=1 Tax=Citreicoccus inhibens TaxID=2849499 RepID=UPI001C213466|nr:zinc-dependent metalloprotease [Citreicoccus inhibens]MBU8897093.1 zinc-dependent metalloprotease [Citreicoccus inhibens]